MSPEVGVECSKTPSISSSFSLLPACNSKCEVSASAPAAMHASLLHQSESKFSAQIHSEGRPCALHLATEDVGGGIMRWGV